MGVKGLRRGRRGWPRRPRKPAAAPTVQALIRADAGAEFQKRLCGAGGGERLLAELATGFWETQWPRLVRQCYLHLSFRCLDVLIHLTDPFDFQVRPMPGHALGWLLEGQAKSGNTRGLEIGPHQQRVVFGRLAQGPIRLRPGDGLLLIGKGGISGALAWFWMWGRENDFHQSPAVQDAWRRWCASRSNRDAAASVLLGPSNPTVSSAWDSALLDIHQALRGNPARQFLDHLCGLLLAKSARSDKPGDVSEMAAWMDRFGRNGWALDHPVWAQWGEGLCEALERSPRSVFAVQNWVRVALAPSRDPTQAVPGWRWNAGMSHILSQAMENAVGRLQRLEGKTPADTLAAELETWMKHTVAIQARLSDWGLMDAAAARAWWDSLVVGDWVEGFLAGRPEGQIHASWRAWLAQRMAFSLPDAGRPRRAARM